MFTNFSDLRGEFASTSVKQHNLMPRPYTQNATQILRAGLVNLDLAMGDETSVNKQSWDAHSQASLRAQCTVSPGRLAPQWLDEDPLRAKV
jgi:hypothetical protein